MNNNYVDQAKGLLSEIGIHQLSEGVWAFTNIHTASQAYIHHSLQPVALAAYAAVNPTFAAGRFPSWALVDMVDKVPCMDGADLTALSMVCGASISTFPSASEHGNIFGQADWGIVEGTDGRRARQTHHDESSIQSWGEIYHGLRSVEIDGWLGTAAASANPRHSPVQQQKKWLHLIIALNQK